MLTGKSALITGSTSGIGRGIAIKLASLGCKVMINGFGDQGDIETLLGELRTASGTDAIHHGADMTKPEEISDMVQTCGDKFGSVDILVNNAGIQFVSPIDEFPVEKWDQIIAINLTSSFHTMRSALPYMKRNQWGRVINVASAHSLVASPYKSAYVAAKHGIAGLTKTVALEVAQQGITVNAISPGYVLTPLVQAQIPDTAAARGISEEQVVNDVLLGAQPTKQFVEIDDVAANVAHLCSDAAKGITGANLSIDGGWTAQ
ncbi:3-hydroxybutyrate dehydrogenase [Amylibacter kogurei]|uniref:3-hydroxybutyrate dehydrogenase n=1 Tax=Paramylibacter kogurei TaxID=1889778 RepID=A0A2G5KAI0_9RHOB|nr:3-hydroxybutyrate dehydrogenase [Amylibacter kogurei]PIB26179.1 3-hydroxybutyrate dehydrogenase [Amylibacter kogurei]